jgi:hypothetical protein
VLFRFQNAPVTGGFGRALLTGDATPATLSFARHTANQYAGLNLENQAFLVPHHGSEHNLPSWLGSYIQGIAIISGSAASPHHPSPKVLEQLSKWTCRSIPKLFCTGYARCCAQAFAARAAAHEKNLVRPGSCFGDLVIRVPRSAPATIEQTSADGNFRRPFGYCGNP